jgi:hypothetical protein
VTEHLVLASLPLGVLVMQWFNTFFKRLTAVLPIRAGFSASVAVGFDLLMGMDLLESVSIRRLR